MLDSNLALKNKIKVHLNYYIASEIVLNEGAKEEELHHLPGNGIPNWKVM